MHLSTEFGTISSKADIPPTMENAQSRVERLAHDEFRVKPDMDALRLICAGELPATPTAPAITDPPISVCGFKAYNDIDGETYTCGLPLHIVKVKHGAWVKL